jgi:type IV secretory pathway VirB3-like protein
MLTDPSVAPIYKSIMFPPLIMGVPKKMFALIAIISLVVVISFSQYWFLIFTVLALLVAKWIAKKDPFVFEITLELMKIPDKAD